MGKHGELYGTTAEGGAYNSGTVFQLTPPSTAGGKWILTTLYTFTSDGGYPSQLVAGAGGLCTASLPGAAARAPESFSNP